MVYIMFDWGSATSFINITPSLLKYYPAGPDAYTSLSKNAM